MSHRFIIPLGLTRFLYTGREAPNTAVDPSTLPSIYYSPVGAHETSLKLRDLREATHQNCREAYLAYDYATHSSWIGYLYTNVQPLTRKQYEGVNEPSSNYVIPARRPKAVGEVLESK